MKALIYTYQGEEFEGEALRLDGVDVSPTFYFNEDILFQLVQDDRVVYLRGKDVRSVVTELPSDALVIGDPTSSDDVPQPSEQPSESSAPTDT